MRSNGLFLFLVLLLSTSLSHGQVANAAPPETNENADILFVCRNNSKALRWLRAYRLESGKCHTVYSKEGYLQIISSATYMSSCEGVLHNVRKNIEEGGFKCTRTESFSYLEIE